jgi:hypothetical protein
MFKNKSKEEKKYLILTIGVISFSIIFIFLWTINLRQIFFSVPKSGQSNQDALYWQDLRANVLGGIEDFSDQWDDIKDAQSLVQGESVLNDLKNKIEEKSPCRLGTDCE